MKTRIDITDVPQNSEQYQLLMQTAEQLHQSKYIGCTGSHVRESRLFGAFHDALCVGFLYLYIQAIGAAEQRPPVVTSKGQPLTEGYVEAFGVLPAFRRQHIGQQLQEQAISYCKAQGCYQMRSRSPITSRENYQLKLKMGYAIHPSNENDSYYFIKILD